MVEYYIFIAGDNACSDVLSIWVVGGEIFGVVSGLADTPHSTDDRRLDGDGELRKGDGRRDHHTPRSSTPRVDHKRDEVVSHRDSDHILPGILVIAWVSG